MACGKYRVLHSERGHPGSRLVAARRHGRRKIGVRREQNVGLANGGKGEIVERRGRRTSDVRKHDNVRRRMSAERCAARAVCRL